MLQALNVLVAVVESSKLVVCKDDCVFATIKILYISCHQLLAASHMPIHQEGAYKPHKRPFLRKWATMRDVVLQIDSNKTPPRSLILKQKSDRLVPSKAIRKYHALNPV